jgi:hypothetical protein
MLQGLLENRFVNFQKIAKSSRLYGLHDAIHSVANWPILAKAPGSLFIHRPLKGTAMNLHRLHSLPSALADG